MGVLRDVEAFFRWFEASNVLLDSCCMERYPFQGGRGIVNPLKSLESVKKMLTLMAELARVCGCFMPCRYFLLMYLFFRQIVLSI